MLQTLKKKAHWLVLTLMTAFVLSPASTYCVQINQSATVDGVLGGVMEIVFKIAFWVGAVLGVSGIFMLILAYKDDNADGQSRAVRLVVVALLLIGLQQLVRLTGLIT